MSIPIFQFLFLRWYFRLIIWFLFLWRVSRLDLRLTPTHPDQAGGLGFLSPGPVAFGPVILAQSAVLSALIGGRILLQGATVASFRYEIAALVILELAVVMGPLYVFAPKLLALKYQGRREYGALAARYTREFHEKWIRGGAPADEPLVGSAEQGRAHVVLLAHRRHRLSFQQDLPQDRHLVRSPVLSIPPGSLAPHESLLLHAG